MYDRRPLSSYIPINGFRWAGRSRKQLIPADEFLPVNANQYRDSEPMRFSTLHREFARLEADEDSICIFANKHGALFHPFTRYTTIDDWRCDIEAMGYAVELWDAISDRNVEAAVSSPLVYSSHAKTLLQSNKGKELQVAMWALAGFINSRVANLGPRLWVNGDHFKSSLRPSNLIDAIWALFYEETLVGISQRPCRICGKILNRNATAADGNRVDRLFCSAACRQKDHRRKVQTARRMKSEGRSIAEIAKFFSANSKSRTTTQTIKNWLSTEK